MTIPQPQPSRKHWAKHSAVSNQPNDAWITELQRSRTPIQKVHTQQGNSHVFHSTPTIPKRKRSLSKTHSLPLFTSPSTESIQSMSDDISEYVNKCLVDAIENGNEIIDLSCLALTEVPSSLQDLGGMISVRGSNSDQLSINITQPSIQLFLQGNLLSELSWFLCSIKNITVLSLRNNRLQIIPSCISQLTRLVELNIGGNQISWLPKEILACSSLQVFNPYPNPFIASSDIKIEQEGSYKWDSLQELSTRTLLQSKYYLFELPEHLKSRLYHTFHYGSKCFECHRPYHKPYSYHVEFITFCTKPDLPMVSFFCHPKHHQQKTT
jgi:Leucine-rich repeat (LRR) protein